MNVKPLSDRVLVKPIEQDKTAKGGIIIPDTAKERPQEGEVIAVGPGRTADSGELIAPAVKKGQKVLYGKYAGTEITIEGDEFLIMQESNILAIIE
ncbi:MAG TPA: co-chaperone GroES [candidate division Zixibacteria bacterium]|nr:co-chaperone GroES [candidate division Zixibacteria bacterium]